MPGRIPPADLVFIGGGQDREQADRRPRARPVRAIDSSGWSARAPPSWPCAGAIRTWAEAIGPRRVWNFHVPGSSRSRTDASASPGRLVGPILGTLDERLPTGAGSDRDATVVGFENHGGRTVLEAGARAFATVEVGHGNNGRDGTEGVLLLPGEGGLDGLRIGTYLHGPLLPRNPHVADALIASALGSAPVVRSSSPRSTTACEWSSHRAARARVTSIGSAGAADPGLGAPCSRSAQVAHRLLSPERHPGPPGRREA